MGGNRRLYRELLRQFVEQQGPAVTQVGEALAAGDSSQAERYAHSLKGVAGNIGATGVQSAAGRLEKAIRERATAADVDVARREAAEVLDGLLTQLQSALDRRAGEAPQGPTTATPVDPARSLEAAAHLARLLSEFDPGAADFLEANHPALRPLFDDGSWSPFEKLVRDYALADAQLMLERALEKYPAA